MKRKVKCKDCGLCRSECLSTYAQQGMYRFDYCAFDPALPRVVDAEVERYCPNAKVKLQEVAK
jgi:hypothetical protein